MRWLFVAVVAMSVVAIAVIPGLVSLKNFRSWLADQQPLLEVHNQRITWVSPRAFEARLDGTTWSRTCPLVIISWGVVLDDGTFIGLPASVTSGQFTGEHNSPSFKLRDVTPQPRGPLAFRFDLPEWINVDDLALYQITATVPNDKPCIDNYVGTSVYRLTIPDPPK